MFDEVITDTLFRSPGRSRAVARAAQCGHLLARFGERAIVGGSTRPRGAVVRLVQFTLGLCLLLVSGCAAQPPVATSEPATPSYSKMSLQLKPEMTEQEVIDTLGQPTKSEISTCGKPYKCKMLIYGVPMRGTLNNSIIIFFTENGASDSESYKYGAIPMDSLITAAARSSARGRASIAWQHVHSRPVQPVARGAWNALKFHALERTRADVGSCASTLTGQRST
jgi:hypothetical protein